MSLLELANNVKVISVDDDVYVGLIVPGCGFCSAKIVPEFRTLALQWEQARLAAIDAVVSKGDSRE